MVKSEIQQGDIKTPRFWAERGTPKKNTGTMTDLAKQPGKRTSADDRPDKESKRVPPRRAITGTDKNKQGFQRAINREE